MLAHTKKHHIRQHNGIVRVCHAGVVYQFPLELVAKYRISSKVINVNDLFANINKKYSKPGALLQGIRLRENITQAEMASLIKVTQSNISQMENGTRRIGRVIAKRIQNLFDVDYRSFLE